MINRDNAMPDIPDELGPRDTNTQANLFPNHQTVVPSAVNKSKSKISITTAQYYSNSGGQRKNTIFGQNIGNPQLVVSNNYALLQQNPLQLVQQRAKSPQRIHGHSVSPAVQFRAAKQNTLNGNSLTPQLQHHYSEYCPSQRMGSSQPVQQVSHLSQPSQVSANILNLMRQQLQFATKNLTARFNEELKRSNEYDQCDIVSDLIRLDKRTKQLEQQVISKQNQLGRLKESYDQVVASRFSNSQRPQKNKLNSEQFSKSYEYLTGRMRDIQLKLRIIIDGLQFRQSEERKIGKVEAKIEQLRAQLLQFEAGRFKQLESRVVQYFSSKQALFANLESQIEQMKVGVLKLDGQVFSVNAFEHKLAAVKKQLEVAQRNLQAFATKEFKYDNFELETLKGQLAKFNKRMAGFEQERKMKIQQLSQLDNQLKMTIEQFKQSAVQLENKSIELDRIKKTVSTRVVPAQDPHIDRKFSTQSQQRIHHNVNFQDYRPSDYESSVEQDDQDVFFHNKKQNPENPNQNRYRPELEKRPKQNRHDNDSSFENFTEEEPSDEQIVECKSNPKLQRLVDIINRSNRKMPLPCEIDQTGYLKFKQSGTYIFDRDGNLFQFSKAQLNEAIGNKVISLS